jgi:uncharacterized protein YukE
MDNHRSVTMTSDSGVAKQYSDYARQIQETLDELQHMQETPRLVTGLEERRNKKPV